jgi:hypothetical protein
MEGSEVRMPMFMQILLKFLCPPSPDKPNAIDFTRTPV